MIVSPQKDNFRYFVKENRFSPHVLSLLIDLLLGLLLATV